MILFPENTLKVIIRESEEAFPNEACGLLLGKRQGANVHIASVHVSRNLADTPRTRFEVDPQLRFDLERLAREKSLDVVAVYHSHPNGMARPSEVDLSKAHEPSLIWIIVALESGKVADRRAYRLDGLEMQFAEVAIQIENS